VLKRVAPTDQPSTPEFEGTTKKALFRSAKALARLDKFEEALDAVTRLSQYKDGLDAASQGLLTEIQKKLQAREREVLAKESAMKETASLEGAVKAALKVSQPVSMKLLSTTNASLATFGSRAPGTSGRLASSPLRPSAHPTSRLTPTRPSSFPSSSFDRCTTRRLAT
jgi:uncharacterized membrane protein